MPRPLVSVIVPVYRTQPWLCECVDSVLSQTYTRLEVLLVDDGSPDGCPAICDRYAAADPRVRVFHKPNTGLADVCNYGLERVSGQYVMFCDSDDTMDPEMVSDMLDAALLHDADIVETDFEDTHRPASTQPQVMTPDQFLHRMLACGTVTMSRCSKMYRRGVLEDVRLTPGILNEDIVFNAQALRHASGVVRLPRIYYNYRQDNAESITHTYAGMEDTYANIARIEAILAPEHAATLRMYRGRVAASICLMCRKFGIRGRFIGLRAVCRRDCRRLLPRLIFQQGFPLKERVKMLWASLLG